MKRTSPLDYAFSIGRIRALEGFLLTQEVFERAIESDLNEALRIFTESGLYSSELLQIKDSQHLEAILSQELLNLKRLISDLILDKPLLGLIDLNSIECIENILKVYPSQFLQDYLLHLIDMHNIKSFLRLHILKEPGEKLTTVLTCEGFIKKKDLLELYTQDLNAFLNRIAYVHKHDGTSDYTYYLGEAIQKIIKEDSFVFLEKAINDFLINILKGAKYLIFGPEPVLAYFFARVNEINLMRMIILAKLNNMAPDLVSQRLNSVYA